MVADSGEVLDIKQGTLLPLLRDYHQNEVAWSVIIRIVEKLKGRIDQSLTDVTDVTSYNKYIVKSGDKVKLFTKDGHDVPIEIEAKYWHAFEGLRQQFDSRNSVLMQMIDAKSAPTEDQVRQWYDQLNDLHKQLIDATEPLLQLLG